MNQPEQENKSLVLELNKYLSHWKALGLFSQHVQRSAGGRCSSSRGAEVLQEALVRAGRVLGVVFQRGGGGGLCLLLLRCLCDCFQRPRSDAGAGAALPFCSSPAPCIQLLPRLPSQRHLVQPHHCLSFPGTRVPQAQLP